MAIKFEVESLDGLDDSIKPLYEAHGDKFRLSVEGLDSGDELKEALRKEREERKAASSRASELEKKQSEAEQKRLEEKQEFEKLWKREKELRESAATELETVKRAISEKQRSETAFKIAAQLTRDTARAALLTKEALQYIVQTPEGVKISGQAGDMTEDQLQRQLAKDYPFLVDGSGAAGGGATGGGASGGAAQGSMGGNRSERVSAIARKFNIPTH